MKQCWAKYRKIGLTGGRNRKKAQNLGQENAADLTVHDSWSVFSIVS
jgi:hypothetical protein